MKAPIQNININIRINKELKNDFIECAKNNGVSYSAILRDFISDYVITKGKK